VKVAARRVVDGSRSNIFVAAVWMNEKNVVTHVVSRIFELAGENMAHNW
jgi:hypothetical protein